MSDDNETSVLAEFATGPARLERAIEGLSEADLDHSPSDGGWSIRQIVHHVVDGDDIWKLCIKSALGDENGEFNLEWYGVQSQDEWAERWAYADRPIDVSLALLQANRDHVMQLIERIPNAMHKSIGMRNPEGQTKRLSVSDVIAILTEHVAHHINRIQAIRGDLGNV